MGIYGLYGRWVRKLGVGVNRRQLPQKVEGIVFDLNGMLHSVAQEVYLYDKARANAERAGVNFEALRQERKFWNAEMALNEYARVLTRTLSDTILKLRPSQYVIIAVDGVAPGAKIAQQRARRYKDAVHVASAAASAAISRRLPPVVKDGDGDGSDDSDEDAAAADRPPKETDLNLGGGAAGSVRLQTPPPPAAVRDVPIAGFSSALISPGTIFMQRVDGIIKEWIKLANTESRTQRRALPPVVFYSNHTIPGEGEHKAFSALRAYTRNNIIEQGTGAHVVYGMDADLLILSLCTNLRGMFLCRENLKEVVSIDDLFSHIKASMIEKAEKGAPCTTFSDTTLRRDFVVISMLVGNDFMPSTPSTSLIHDDLFKAYVRTGMSLTNSPLEPDTVENMMLDSYEVDPGFINLLALTRFFTALASYEQSMISANCRREVNRIEIPVSPSIALESGAYTPNPASDDGVLDFKALHGAWYDKIKTIRVETSLSGKVAKDRDVELMEASRKGLITRIVTDYIGIISWMFRYYLGGQTRVNWMYAYKFLNAPFAMDVANILAKHLQETTKFVSKQLKVPESDRYSVTSTVDLVEYVDDNIEESHFLVPGGITEQSGDLRGRGKSALEPIHQILAITPPSRISVVAGSRNGGIISILSADGTLGYLAPLMFELYTAGKSKEYMAVPILPEIDFSNLIDGVNEAEADVAKAAALAFASPEAAEKRRREKEENGDVYDKKGNLKKPKLAPSIPTFIPRNFITPADIEPIRLVPAYLNRRKSVCGVGGGVGVGVGGVKERKESSGYKRKEETKIEHPKVAFSVLDKDAASASLKREGGGSSSNAAAVEASRKEDIKEAVAAEIRKVSDEAEEENEKSVRSAAAASSNTGGSNSGGADVKIPEKCLKIADSLDEIKKRMQSCELDDLTIDTSFSGLAVLEQYDNDGVFDAEAEEDSSSRPVIVEPPVDIARKNIGGGKASWVVFGETDEADALYRLEYPPKEDEEKGGGGLRTPDLFKFEKHMKTEYNCPTRLVRLIDSTPEFVRSSAELVCNSGALDASVLHVVGGIDYILKDYGVTLQDLKNEISPSLDLKHKKGEYLRNHLNLGEDKTVLKHLYNVDVTIPRTGKNKEIRGANSVLHSDYLTAVVNTVVTASSDDSSRDEDVELNRHRDKFEPTNIIGKTTTFDDTVAFQALRSSLSVHFEKTGEDVTMLSTAQVTLHPYVDSIGDPKTSAFYNRLRQTEIMCYVGPEPVVVGFMWWYNSEKSAIINEHGMCGEPKNSPFAATFVLRRGDILVLSKIYKEAIKNKG